MEGGEAYEPPRFCIEVNVPRGHHGATPESTVEVTIDLHSKIVGFDQLFGDI